MKKGYLSQYFDGFAVKRLSPVEADVMRSNQHEFNGVQQLKNILGSPQGKQSFKTKFIFMSDTDAESISDEGFMTWYDARENHPTRSECRLYFSNNQPLLKASESDLLLIAKKQDGTLLVLIAKNNSTIERQILWLFASDDYSQQGFSVRENPESEKDKLNFTSRFILEEIGVEVEEDAGENFLEIMLEKFQGRFPPTMEFSRFARATLPEIYSRDNPDAALIAWMEQEERLFKTLERHILEKQLRTGFGSDMVDGFLALSLSVQNRRKSRAGSALENHLEQVFLDHGISFSREKITENKHRPDFVFPSIEKYQLETFPAENLKMLAVKSTCKERWRQILNEAVRIKQKHLFTLEPGISEHQTSEMKTECVQLVVPVQIHGTFTVSQRGWLITLNEFLQEVCRPSRDRQGASLDVLNHDR